MPRETSQRWNSGPASLPRDEAASVRLVSLAPDHLEVSGVKLAQFCDGISRRLDRDVVDKTGISGVFDIRIEGSPKELFSQLTSTRRSAKLSFRVCPRAGPGVGAVRIEVAAGQGSRGVFGGRSHREAFGELTQNEANLLQGWFVIAEKETNGHNGVMSIRLAFAALPPLCTERLCLSV